MRRAAVVALIATATGVWLPTQAGRLAALAWALVAVAVAASVMAVVSTPRWLGVTAACYTLAFGLTLIASVGSALLSYPAVTLAIGVMTTGQAVSWARAGRLQAAARAARTLAFAATVLTFTITAALIPPQASLTGLGIASFLAIAWLASRGGGPPLGDAAAVRGSAGGARRGNDAPFDE